ncbi:amidohydrolase [Puteibacter caeruleilacunae]|nr:amidohydrolase [Puteibacter caeruleilacunae]
MKKIDCHTHAFPWEALEAMQKYYPELIELHTNDDGSKYAIWAKTPLPAWNGQKRIDKMDKAEIDIEVIQNPIIYNKLDENTPDLCRAVNNSLAQACNEFPERFKFLVSLPLNDMPETIKEIARAVDELGASGIVIPSNVNGLYLDNPQFIPFWEEVARRDLMVFIHPLYSSFYKDDEGPTLLAFPFDTTLSAVKLVLSGFFEKFKNVKIILSHMGGALPYMARRIDVPFEIPSFLPGYSERLIKLPSEYMKNFYLDTSLNWSKSAFNCAKDLVGIEHLVFASDFFIETTDYDERTIHFIESLELSDIEKKMVYSENINELLK